jgi:hypothetical protein
MSRALAAALCLAFAALPCSALAENAQQNRMKTCNEKATGMKGDERKAFMSKCLKGEEEKPAVNAQQQKMKDCNEKAKGKKGDERKKFMSECLKG